MSNSTGSDVGSVIGAQFWSGDSKVGTIAASIAAWSMLVTGSQFLLAGMLLAYRYNAHSRLKLKEREARSLTSGSGLASLEHAAAAAVSAGANIYILWVTVLIPVLWTLIGALAGFLVGFAFGALLAGIFIFGNVVVTPDLQIFIGASISCVLLFFQMMGSSIQFIFL